jgi:hypothetical protein
VKQSSLVKSGGESFFDSWDNFEALCDNSAFFSKSDEYFFSREFSEIGRQLRNLQSFDLLEIFRKALNKTSLKITPKNCDE